MSCQGKPSKLRRKRRDETCVTNPPSWIGINLRNIKPLVRRTWSNYAERGQKWIIAKFRGRWYSLTWDERVIKDGEDEKMQLGVNIIIMMRRDEWFYAEMMDAKKNSSLFSESCVRWGTSILGRPTLLIKCNGWTVRAGRDEYEKETRTELVKDSTSCALSLHPLTVQEPASAVTIPRVFCGGTDAI
jgi:hypothetical protein